MVSSKSIYHAAMRILKDHKEKLDECKKKYAPPTPPSVRNKPTELEVWCRYSHAVVTIRQKISPNFWDELQADPRWVKLTRAQFKQKPSPAGVEKLLRKHHVNRAKWKAELLLKGWDCLKGQECSFDGLARKLRETLGSYHDEGRSPKELREVERDLADHIRKQLRGCGVGPKVARLMMIWNPVTHEMGHYFQHVIPIDSRWLSSLKAAGGKIGKRATNTEKKYREIEEEICRATYKLGFLPFHADCAVFESFAGE